MYALKFLLISLVPNPHITASFTLPSKWPVPHIAKGVLPIDIV